MAGEIGHVVCAARAATYLGDQVGHPSFWAGTLFPNIKHLGISSRQPTHASEVVLATLLGPSDFFTGARVHAWIDLTREQFLKDMNAKELLPWHPLTPYAYQLVEDYLLYDRFADWDLVIHALNRTYDEELKHIDSLQHVTKWHSTLQQYLKQKPDDNSRQQFALDIGLSKQTADEINRLVKLLANHKPAIKLIDQFLLHLESLFK